MKPRLFQQRAVLVSAVPGTGLLRARPEGAGRLREVRSPRGQRPPSGPVPRCHTGLGLSRPLPCAHRLPSRGHRTRPAGCQKLWWFLQNPFLMLFESPGCYLSPTLLKCNNLCPELTALPLHSKTSGTPSNHAAPCACPLLALGGRTQPRGPAPSLLPKGSGVWLNLRGSAQISGC